MQDTSVVDGIKATICCSREAQAKFSSTDFKIAAAPKYKPPTIGRACGGIRFAELRPRVNLRVLAKKYCEEIPVSYRAHAIL
jgi:hypothetical protein